MNSVQLVGNLGKDPELRQTTSGKSVCTLALATTEGFGDSEKTEWHNVVCWEKTADSCAKYLQKGSKVGATGRIQTRSWEDKEGNKRYTTEVVAHNVEFLSPKSTYQETAGKVDVQEGEAADPSVPF